MTDLKPCPFCGGKAKVYKPDPEVDPQWYIACPNYRECCAPTAVGMTYEEAAASWNRRADDPLKERVCETLKHIMPDECYAGEARAAADCDGCELRDGCDRYVALKALAEWRKEATSDETEPRSMVGSASR